MLFALFVSGQDDKKENIRNTNTVNKVMENGRLYDG